MLGDKQNVAFDDLSKMRQLGLVKCIFQYYQAKEDEKKQKKHRSVLGYTVNSQLACLPPVGIFSQVMFIYHCLFTLVQKSPDGEWTITYTFT